ncbi:MAG: glutamate-cysteine ligase family protein [Methanomassiliicoccales archaeon]|nr:glutamate-cysteine ligase family protein [Methanomassiliicoccales archaeon]
MTIGTEHEYSLNDTQFRPLPINDQIIQRINGSIVNEFPYGPVILSKELQKHVIELVPAVPARNVAELEGMVYSGLQKLQAELGPDIKMLGLGMHPLLELSQTAVWDHEDKEIYETYDRLFDIHQHGWLNIQALQMNLPFRNDDELVSIYNRIRALTPFLVAIAASSPYVEGKATGKIDNRLIYYRKSQQKLPVIGHGVIPERLSSKHDYLDIQQEMYAALRKEGAEILCHEWVDSRGLIVRFSRNCVEVKALDEQECVRSDMAVTAFVLALLRSDLSLEEDEGALKDMLENAIEKGTADLKPELRRLYQRASEAATGDERRYLPLIRTKIEAGNLAEEMLERARTREEILGLLPEMERSLRINVPYQCDKCKASKLSLY